MFTFDYMADLALAIESIIGNSILNNIEIIVLFTIGIILQRIYCIFACFLYIFYNSFCSGLGIDLPKNINFCLGFILMICTILAVFDLFKEEDETLYKMVTRSIKSAHKFLKIRFFTN